MPDPGLALRRLPGLAAAQHRKNSSNIVWHQATVTRERRERQNAHKSCVLWFTGLSGSGKSTLAHAVEESLHQLGCRTYVLDGDNLRHGLCSNLGFSEEDRSENIRRIGETAKLMMEVGPVLISPTRRQKNPSWCSIPVPRVSRNRQARSSSYSGGAASCPVD